MNDDGEYVHVAGLTPDAHRIGHCCATSNPVDTASSTARRESTTCHTRARRTPRPNRSAGKAHRRSREGGAQHLVTVDDVDHRRADRRYVECTGDLQDDGNVAGRGVGVEPVDEPCAAARTTPGSGRGRTARAVTGPGASLVVGHLLDQFPDRRRGEHAAGSPPRRPGPRRSAPRAWSPTANCRRCRRTNR